MDRPKLREKIKAIMADCTEYYQSDEYDLECSQEFFRSDKFFDQILALIPDRLDKPPYPINEDFWSMNDKEREAWRKGAQAQRELCMGRKYEDNIC